MHILSGRRFGIVLSVLTACVVPFSAAAATTPALDAMQGDTGALLGILLLLLLFSVVLTRVWVGMVNVSFLSLEPIDSIERRHPYIPPVRVIALALLGTVLLLYLSLRAFHGVAPFEGDDGLRRSIGFFGVVGPLAILALLKWRHAREYIFACAVGSSIAFFLIGFQKAIMDASSRPDAVALALGVLGVALAWKFLFGPWTPHIKATVLGTFLFWIAVEILWREAPTERWAHLLAAGVAIIPAIVWCVLFLKYHHERLTLVLLMFFSGMLSTVPILFYDALVRSGTELQFLLFKVVLQNFTAASNSYVSGVVSIPPGVQTTLLASLLSFLLVGLIEEGSKFWVLQRSGQASFRSVNDVVELAIIVAIGFAFAENVINPTYFVAFVKASIFSPGSADWGSFFGNIVGRSILTTMVHIVSTGVIGYFYGCALFAGPVLSEAHARGKSSLFSSILHSLLCVSEASIFRRQMIMTGIVAAVILHGLFNFLVSLPDLLPGNPHTLGDLFGSGSDSFLQYCSIILIPSLFYVLGGFWILSLLFSQKENERDRGVLITVDTFVRE